jgi:hypothetical protein
MNAVKKPYELLVRWDQEGKLRGAHVQWATVVTDNSGTPIGCYPGTVEPISVAQDQSGFPLTDILGQIQADALAALAAVQQRSDALAQQLSEANAQIAVLQTQVSAVLPSEALSETGMN